MIVCHGDGEMMLLKNRDEKITVFPVFWQSHKIIISHSEQKVKEKLFEIVKFYFLHKTILCISNNLPIAKSKKIWYTISAKEVRSDEILSTDQSKGEREGVELGSWSKRMFGVEFCEWRPDGIRTWSELQGNAFVSGHRFALGGGTTQNSSKSKVALEKEPWG